MEKTKPNEIIRVAFYIRVSTDEQAKHGYGVEMQTQALQDMIAFKNKHNNWVNKKEWVFIDDGYTGADLKRPEFERMMKSVKNNEFDIIAVWKIDRMSRNLTHLLHVFETLQQHNASFYSLKENVDFTGAIGKLTFQIFGALAEFERETIRARTLEGKIASARTGNWTGAGIPYGYKPVKRKSGKGKTLEIVKEEAKWVKQIFEWFIYDNKSYSEITRELNSLKVPKGVASTQKRHRGKEWSDVVVRGMLKNETYTGLRIQKMKDGDGDVVSIKIETPKIIPRLLFDQAQLCVKRITETKGKRGGGQITYLLSRKIIDLETGRKFIGYTRGKGGTGYRRKGFVDTDETKYKNREIPGKAIEEYVWGHIKLAINKPKEFYKIYQRQNLQNIELKRYIRQVELCKEHIEKAENSINNVIEDFYSGNLPEEQKERLENKYKTTIKNNEEKIIKLEKEIKRIEEIQIASNALKEFSKNFKKKLDNLTIEQKQLIVELLIDKIEVFEDDEGIKLKTFFRFAQEKAMNDNTGVEPKNSLNKTKNTPNGVSSELDGGRTRTRT